MIKIETTFNNTHLPLKIIQGSEKKRFKMAKNLNRVFFQRLNPKCNGENCSVKDFENTLNEILNGHKISFQINKETRKECNGSLGLNIKGTEEKDKIKFFINGYRISLPLDESEKIIKDKFVAFHETRHLFDKITNPKMNQHRLGHVIFTSQDVNDKIGLIWQTFFDNFANKKSKSELIKQIEGYFKGIDTGIKIDNLQKIRMKLKTEINAYNDEINLMKKDSFFKYLDRIINTRIYSSKLMKYKLKLKVANTILKKELTNQRNKNAILYSKH